MKLKKIFIILAAFFCAFNFIYAQNVSENTVSESEIIISNNSDIENPEKQFVISDTQNVTNSRKTNGVWVFIRMILVLAVVIAAIYFVMNFMKKSVNGEPDTDDVYLRKVAQVTLSPGKTVQVITLLDKGYIVGVSENSVNLISEIDDKELISAMNLSSDKQRETKKARNFAEVLEMFMPSRSSHETEATKANLYSDVSQNMQDFVNNQRKRINKKGKKE
ncbi:MAG: flagellar biosynthetic protein FliO [Treponema sp.]|nr:flagellar biosynthetic protein FliO [Candidatus Treponema merdequi]